jgi:hypothetical protein
LIDGHHQMVLVARIEISFALAQTGYHSRSDLLLYPHNCGCNCPRTIRDG